MRVAIADDDPIVCSSLSTILEATGTADVAWTANTGTDAVTQYEMDAPRCVAGRRADAGNGRIASVGGDS